MKETLRKYKTLRTLNQNMFQWLKGREPSDEPASNKERGRFYRIREVAKKEISDLTSLAELLPEKQLGQIFNEELKPFFRALFCASSYFKEKQEDGYFFVIPENSSKKRDRMLKVINLALKEIALTSNADILARNTWLVVMQMPSSNSDMIYESKAILALQIEGGFMSHSMEKMLPQRFKKR